MWLLDQKAKVPPRLGHWSRCGRLCALAVRFELTPSCRRQDVGLTDKEVSAIRDGQYEGFPARKPLSYGGRNTMADTPSNVNHGLYAELCCYFPSNNSWN